MRYRVACLTHGDAETLERTLDSFIENVTPEPYDWIILQDGPGEWTIPDPFIGYAGGWDEQVGFCEATRRLWKVTSQGKQHEFDGRGSAFYIRPPAPPYVFWLEHDFVFTRQLDLEPLAAQLDADPSLAQMSLMRGPVNEKEMRAGGLFESRPGEYDLEFTNFLDRSEAYPWLRHHSYFTTNPMLMRTEFMVENEWPDYDEQCEGRFGLDLMDRGYSSGVWGSGEVWVEHIGTRSGINY